MWSLPLDFAMTSYLNIPMFSLSWIAELYYTFFLKEYNSTCNDCLTGFDEQINKYIIYLGNSR
jgi:hypothetical protein